MSAIATNSEKFLGTVAGVMAELVANCDGSATSCTYRTKFSTSISRIVGGRPCAITAREHSVMQRAAARSLTWQRSIEIPPPVQAHRDIQSDVLLPEGNCSRGTREW